MAEIDYALPPYSFYSPPGSINISPAALALALRFRDAAVTADPAKDWVIVFDWGDTRRIRQASGTQWLDLGPGIDLAAYERTDLPNGVTDTIEHMPVALKVPGHITLASVRRLIDRDDTLMSKLRLL